MAYQIQWYESGMRQGEPDGKYGRYSEAYAAAERINRKLGRGFDWIIVDAHNPWKCWRCRIARMCFYLAIGLAVLGRILQSLGR
jgi:hypothetical protein